MPKSSLELVPFIACNGNRGRNLAAGLIAALLIHQGNASLGINLNNNGESGSKYLMATDGKFEFLVENWFSVVRLLVQTFNVRRSTFNR